MRWARFRPHRRVGEKIELTFDHPAMMRRAADLSNNHDRTQAGGRSFSELRIHHVPGYRV
jgi:hypothetical protein